MLDFVKSILVFLLSTSSLVASITPADLYPYEGFPSLVKGDDEAHEIEANPPVHLYDQTFDKIYVNTNGLLSFERDISPYRSDFEIPFDHFHIIAPFYADVDTTTSGTITFGQSSDPSLLERAAREISAAFPRFESFRPTALYIFTWVDVGYYQANDDKKNTFQAVLATDGEKTFIFLMYPEGGLNWHLGEDKEGIPGISAQVGFSVKDRFYELSGSKFQRVLYLPSMSNIEEPGKFIYLTGSAEGNLEDPSGVVSQAPLPEDHLPYDPARIDDSTDQDHHQDPYHPDQDHHQDPYHPDQEHHQDPYHPDQDHHQDPYHPDQDHHQDPYHPDHPEHRTHPDQDHQDPYHPDQEHHQDPYHPDQDHHQDPYHPDHPEHRTHPEPSEHPVYPEDPHDRRQQEVYEPYYAKAPVEAPLETCSTHGACGEHANCQDYPTGYCCHCTGTYFGNGIDCVMEDGKIHISGEIIGRVNEQMLTMIKTNSYAVLKDGRSFTSVTEMTDDQKLFLSHLPIISTALGFLFGIKDDPDAKRGFEYTGGKFNRIVTVEFGENEHYAEVRQMFTKEKHGKFLLTTEVTGTVPITALAPNSQVVMTPVEYMKTETGKFTATGQHTFVNADGTSTYAKFHESIIFEECAAHVSPYIESILVTVKTAEVKIRKEDSSLRFPLTSHISIGHRLENPCLPNPCGAHSDCEVAGSYYNCKCHPGYVKQGDYCMEDPDCVGDHCRRSQAGLVDCGPEPCHSYASCEFDHELYRYECKCSEGYEGDGKSYCNSYDSCHHLYCDPRAQCVYSDELREYQCVCPPGTYGDGKRCEFEQLVIEEDDCSRNQAICHPDGLCDYSYEYSRYMCACKPGFQGDGRSCVRSEETVQSCRELNNCDYNAECAYDQQYQMYKCKCGSGYWGDGFRCASIEDRGSVESEDCLVKKDICDSNAECQYDHSAFKYMCTCRLGFEGDGKYCARIDCNVDPKICDRNARCESESFTNYRCKCLQGFIGDGVQSCVPQIDESITDNLVYAQGTFIARAPVRDHHPNDEKLLSFTKDSIPVAVDVDCAAQKIYWTDLSDRSIHVSELNGDQNTVVISKLHSPEGLAIDWIAGNIYWTDTGTNVIQVARLDGSTVKTLFDKNITSPRSIAVDPVRGLIFWTDWNLNDPKIESSNLDGSDRKVLVQTGLKLPNGLALDYESQFVCWADAGTKKIECVTYGGLKRRVVVDDAGFSFGLAYHNENFYWTNWNDPEHIKTAGKHSSEMPRLINITPGVNARLYGLSVVKATCPHGTNPCSHRNGGCKYLCFASLSGGRTCACPDDVGEEECKRSTYGK